MKNILILDQWFRRCCLKKKIRHAEQRPVTKAHLEPMAHLFVLLLYVPCQQLWSLRDGQFT